MVGLFQVALDESACIARLDDSEQKRQQTNRLALTAIIDVIRYLGESGSAFRGHRDEKVSSNVWRLMGVIQRYNPIIKEYFSDDSDVKFLSPKIQNEILSIISDNILRTLLTKVNTQSRGVLDKSKPIFSLIIDETSDVSNVEQVSVCIRYCTDNYQSDEIFLGFYATAKTDAASLKHIVNDVFQRYGFTVSQLRGQAYDGGSNMAGRISGLQKRIADENSKALYFHCAGHQLSLVCQDACSENPFAGQVISTMNAIVNYVRDSPKRWSAYNQLVSVANFTTHQIRPFCPTRWVMRLAAIDAIVENYKSLLDFLLQSSEDMLLSAHQRSLAFSHLETLETFRTFYFLKLLQHLFSTIQPVHAKCQGRDTTSGEMQKYIAFLVEILSKDAASEKNSKLFFLQIKQQAICLNIDLPTLPRRFRSHTEKDLDEFYGQAYTNLLSSAAKSLSQRYSSRALTMADKLRRLLDDPIMSNSEIQEVSAFYSPDWSAPGLSRERLQWFARCSSNSVQPSVENLRSAMVTSPVFADIAPNLHVVLVTYIVLPISSCEAERSFSMLRRLKTYLRATQTQKRLNNLAIINSHQTIAETVDLQKILEEFTDRYQARRNRFGNASLF